MTGNIKHFQRTTDRLSPGPPSSSWAKSSNTWICHSLKGWHSSKDHPKSFYYANVVSINLVSRWLNSKAFCHWWFFKTTCNLLRLELPSWTLNRSFYKAAAWKASGIAFLGFFFIVRLASEFASRFAWLAGVALFLYFAWLCVGNVVCRFSTPLPGFLQCLLLPMKNQDSPTGRNPQRPERSQYVHGYGSKPQQPPVNTVSTWLKPIERSWMPLKRLGCSEAWGLWKPRRSEIDWVKCSLGWWG